jgi:putative FmdB family regulatory protein
MYRKARRDSNESHLVAYLRRCGATVVFIDESGVPDLLLGFQGINLLFEVKSEEGTLTKPQTDFFKMWQGQKAIVRTVRDVKEELRNIQMPIRVFICPECGEFAKKQKFSENPLTECPTCGSMVTQRYTLCGIIYKGDGWYAKENSK